jgi:hypothetical protein
MFQGSVYKVATVVNYVVIYKSKSVFIIGPCCTFVKLVCADIDWYESSMLLIIFPTPKTKFVAEISALDTTASAQGPIFA